MGEMSIISFSSHTFYKSKALPVVELSLPRPYAPLASLDLPSREGGLSDRLLLELW